MSQDNGSMRRRPRLSITKNLKVPNYYTLALDSEFAEFAFSEERAPLNKGKWRQQIFRVPDSHPIDLEIGTGNGVHFQKRLQLFPERCLLGLEIKYKPLIQTIRGALRNKTENGRSIRYHALELQDLFLPEELNHIFMHFPDPWTSPRKPKNRMIQKSTLDLWYTLQRPGSFFELKTDSSEFFDWSLEIFAQSSYQIVMQSRDLHREGLPNNYVCTTFEKIFLKQGLPIHYVLLKKDGSNNAKDPIR
jgi:tRNA (guanine-N7-)-methyltransferase